MNTLAILITIIIDPRRRAFINDLLSPSTPTRTHDLDAEQTNYQRYLEAKRTHPDNEQLAEDTDKAHAHLMAAYYQPVLRDGIIARMIGMIGHRSQ